MDFYFEKDQRHALGSPNELTTSGRTAISDEQGIHYRYEDWDDSALIRKLNDMK